MATSSAIKRRWMIAATTVGLLGPAVAAAAIAPGVSGSRAAHTGAGAGALARSSLSRLRPGPAPATWRQATIASGAATLSYPRGWKPISGDVGTVSFALRDRSGRYLGYINVTPRQGEERLAGWAAFRTRRNAEDEDKAVHALASAERVRFAGAHGSCVIDEYASRVGSNAYRELACIVAGKRSTAVFVGATLVADWPTLGPIVERAASSLIER
jgi:hypothetical protein